MRYVLLAGLVLIGFPGCKMAKRTVVGTAKVGKFAVKTTGKLAVGAGRTVVGTIDRGSARGESSSGRSTTYTVRGKSYRTMTWDQAHGFEQSGEASWYGREGGWKTATGEHYRPAAMTAAHKTLPLGAKVRVTNLRNGRKVTVRINDRGPFIKGRIIDCSRAAADRLGFKDRGVTEVQIRMVGRY